MKFNRKSLSIQEIDYAMKMELESESIELNDKTNNNEQYHANYEKQLNVKVTKFNENTNPSNFYYNFIFHDSYLYKQRNVNKRYYPMLKRYKKFNQQRQAVYEQHGIEDNDVVSDKVIKRIIFQHKKKYKLSKTFRKTYKQLKQHFAV